MEFERMRIHAPFIYTVSHGDRTQELILAAVSVFAAQQDVWYVHGVRRLEKATRVEGILRVCTEAIHIYSTARRCFWFSEYIYAALQADHIHSSFVHRRYMWLWVNDGKNMLMSRNISASLPLPCISITVHLYSKNAAITLPPSSQPRDNRRYKVKIAHINHDANSTRFHLHNGRAMRFFNPLCSAYFNFIIHRIYFSNAHCDGNIHWFKAIDVILISSLNASRLLVAHANIVYTVVSLVYMRITFIFIELVMLIQVCACSTAGWLAGWLACVRACVSQSVHMQYVYTEHTHTLAADMWVE